MPDLNERPAVPPMPEGADVRYGYYLGGGVLVALGWGLLDVANFLAHRLAGSDGLNLGLLRVYPGFGPFSQAAAIFGAGTGVLGFVLLWYGTTSPEGRFVLPGTPY
ncbi:MAG: hypothetical protein L3K08_06270 [Thermoplasmata archaeon]|nr:hypothetical protein [Thermoplasmata archaeon]